MFIYYIDVSILKINKNLSKITPQSFLSSWLVLENILYKYILPNKTSLHTVLTCLCLSYDGTSSCQKKSAHLCNCTLGIDSLQNAWLPIHCNCFYCWRTCHWKSMSCVCFGWSVTFTNFLLHSSFMWTIVCFEVIYQFSHSVVCTCKWPLVWKRHPNFLV